MHQNTESAENPVAAPSISVIIPVYNAASYLRECLESLRRSTVACEVIVVDDGSTDGSADVAREYGVTLFSCGRRSGPAHARNVGASAARADILLFVDADVCVHPDTVALVLADFRKDPEIDAVIGSYDDTPRSTDFLSLYKNLLQCYVHQNARRRASTFWSGCGAIRKAVFLAHGGFDESYRRPCIEDIELGYRLRRERRKLILDADVRVKHLKHWSFGALIKTDILDRGAPWTELILRDKRLPDDLNLRWTQRISVALVFLLIGLAAVCIMDTVGLPFVLTLLLLLFVLLVRVAADTARTQWGSIAIVSMVAAIAVLAFWNRTPWLLPPVLLTYPLLYLRRRYAYTRLRLRRATGLICGMYVACMILLVLFYLPRHPLVFGFFLVLSVVILLNTSFYMFLAPRTGSLIALAAIPVHLLFYFYNGVAFLIGLAGYSLKTALRSGKQLRMRFDQTASGDPASSPGVTGDRSAADETRMAAEESAAGTNPPAGGL